ncbi:hypothetical protein JG688_00005519 [Phytophthora aleatoria]|uniref:DNA replication checkpoint mediator MRC1 domain-containing protein n=1 Tax=Phytophthora aleatoria TaxID=2496075 RepID=A0A8J5JCW2_9STRA|nr:hypothetical protein JG688_00005519 [Phytophthora aleatoria]
MSGEELALETQLLLQEATQITQQAAVESVLESAGAPPPETEYEAAKSALLAKLRKKKEANRVHHQQLNHRRLGVQTPQSAAKKNDLFSPRKALKLPVATTASATSRKKQDMLFKLRTQAIQQGAQNMAELFGYVNYEDHFKAINEEEEKNILANEKLKEKQEKQEKDKEEGEQEEQEDETEPMDTSVEDTEKPQEEEKGSMSPKAVVDEIPTPTETESGEQMEHESVKVVRRRNRIQKPDAEEDGNEADSEQDDKEGDDADEEMEDATEAVEATNDAEMNTEEAKPAKFSTPKDKAAAYRKMLLAEALQTRKRKRLIKGGDKFVESEAEEDEEEDVLKIGGLGDFGFGVPQAKTQESKEAEEERNALKLREDDLDHIVDDLSDEERAQEQDLDEMFRREQEDQDRQQVKEVMRNVKEGFGRNRRAFSGLHSGSGARGRFNLDELVAADGSKFEAARLGLLESDEEISEDESGEKKKKEGEEEDEEAQMERMLRERFLNQPQIYVTSSESGSDNEEEDEVKKDNGPDGDEVESDEERERQQMKLFSERARINRRMQRMKDLQRQISLENNEDDPNTKSAAMPNLLLEEDEDSQELMHMMNRTDVDSAPKTTTGAAQKKARTDRSRPKLGRFNSYGGITSASRGSSSFSRVIGHCKLFSANSTGGGAASSKGFVFTSFSSDKAEDGDENAAPNHDEAMPATRPEFGKSKSWSGAKTAAKRRGAPGANDKTSNKKRKSGGLFSVLSSFQCTSQYTALLGRSCTIVSTPLSESNGEPFSENPRVLDAMSSSHSRPQSTSNSGNSSDDSSSERERHNDTRGSSSSIDGSIDTATINGPYRVGNSDGDTCSYHAVQEGESCRKPRTCYECLNSDVAGVSDGCLLAPSGFCEDMSSYDSTLDYRRNITGEDLSLTGWYNYFPSVNSTYCEPTDEACVLCDELVNNGSLSQASHWGFKTENVSTEVERQLCIGTDGCVCVMACETDNWEANMPAECDANGSASGNNNSSANTTSYSTFSSRTNSDLDTCAYYGLEPGERCFTHRSCYDCLNVPVATDPEGCVLSQFGYCMSMVFYDYTLDYRVTTGPNADSGSPYNFSGGLYHQFEYFLDGVYDKSVDYCQPYE